jgi:hypothetical protein
MEIGRELGSIAGRKADVKIFLGNTEDIMLKSLIYFFTMIRVQPLCVVLTRQSW